jgi:xylose isomerase
MDPKLATMVMWTVLRQNGLNSGGLNFDCKVRRESTDLEDLFIAHIAAMDVLAYGLKTAAKIIKDGVIETMVKDRYISYTTTPLGKKIEEGKATFEDCEEYVKSNGEVKTVSGKQEKFEKVYTNYFL